MSNISKLNELLAALGECHDMVVALPDGKGRTATTALTDTLNAAISQALQTCAKLKEREDRNQNEWDE